MHSHQTEFSSFFYIHFSKFLFCTLQKFEHLCPPFAQTTVWKMFFFKVSNYISFFENCSPWIFLYESYLIYYTTICYQIGPLLLLWAQFLKNSVREQTICKGNNKYLVNGDGPPWLWKGAALLSNYGIPTFFSSSLLNLIFW